MKLPALPYRGEKTKRQITAFRGLDLTQEAEDGALRDSYGLSTSMWPCLSPRQRREVLDSYQDPTDLFAWDGKLVVVDGSVLYYDGQAISNVLPGRKQFAVVNSKLCIWPDKTYIDLTNGEYGHLDAKVETTGLPESTTMTHNSISASVHAKIKGGLEFGYMGRKGVFEPTIYTYGTIIESFKECWHDGAWDQQKLEELKKYKGIIWSEQDGTVSQGDIIIPRKVGDGFIPVDGNGSPGGSLPDLEEYNTEGYYALVTENRHEYGSAEGTKVTLCFDVYKVGVDTALFSSVFQVGDAVNISGTPYGIADVEHARITEIVDQTNSMLFPQNTLTVPSYYYSVSSAGLEDDTEYQFCVHSNFSYYYYKFRTVERLSFRDVLFILGIGEQETLYLWSSQHHRIVNQWTCQRSTTTYGVDKLWGTSYSLDGAVLTIRRDVPDLDFICECNNRLWGVSNRQSNSVYNQSTKKLETFTSRVIYASALGNPSAFWSFDGLSTDSYQVAMGSEGDFTAICAYGDSILCWKENMLHKILGNYPAQFYMNDYHISGVRAGAHRSLQLINETLFYLGRDGVYAYSGGMPSNLSRKLGVLSLTNAAGGTDGQRYLISGTDPSGAGTLLSYDLARRVWLREDHCAADAFALVGQDRYLLTHNKIYRYNDALYSERVPWMAELAPFYEDPFTKSGYTRLVLSLEMSEGSWITAEVCEDCGPWRKVWTQRAANRMTFCAPLRIGRCDRFQLRLSGEGDVVVRGLMREFKQMGGNYDAKD